MWFTKKKQVEFCCLIGGVDKVMPVVRARDLEHAWVNSVRTAYAEQRKQPDFGMTRSLHTAKCPGIFSLMRHGWVVRTWQDIVIETNGDKNSFSWTTPIDQKALPFGSDYVGFHDAHSLADHMQDWPDNALRVALKINSPWMARIPKGYYLLEMPVAYGDESRFTTLPGFFDCDHGPAPLSQQLLWHVLEGKTLIKAGTPLAQYVLVPKEQADFVVSGYDANCSDIQARALLAANRFVANYKHLTQVFK